MKLVHANVYFTFRSISSANAAQLDMPYIYLMPFVLFSSSSLRVLLITCDIEWCNNSDSYHVRIVYFNDMAAR